ncbi:MAG: ATP-binding cassette domain-containing protein [Candidatus Marinimicrobia bacterium]|jgi:ABC-2 type transport system ATP-binding protein|nr:ATP-binding cassette domain-containing protein [Candidatus Neomarinimicrobiota bacterium]MBT3630630.1 ATP-binding cassette domain-containing protein [Candidatus Neomarinimicrobiota bacterium]MBT3825510.1 ATP-binding cassette domain-containing protein [Candidatus Neomarinimicrobiota bacterium]MBT4131828.1 ATP-binding cassette domain-containing protein [Candidatus Neomarinimicrobiota bacterium]MBT4295592.1 ATP-binding cassette domain-containing protein [Candidatus Neomarinimicrobiota bacterium
MNALTLHNITKTFNDFTAVDSLSLEVPEGSIYGFIGPNGSGKTTTIRMIMNILHPDSGDIQVLGSSRAAIDNDLIGYLPEERGLYKKMKIRELLHFYGELKTGHTVAEEVNTWLTKLDLAEWGNKKVEALSKGMSQKVQFIATVVSNPKLVILDEPFSGLDPVNTDVLLQAMLELQKNGATVIFSTHDMATAEKVCDYVFMIHKGKKVLDGTLHEIQDKYGSDTLRIRCDNKPLGLERIAGVDKVHDFGQSQELRISAESNPQDILKELMKDNTLLSFELMKPSLHDIFVRIAGAKEVDHV